MARTQRYGSCGRLTRRQWRDLLASGTGLFTPVAVHADGVIGPTLVKSGRIIGDMLAMETSLFAAAAEPAQYDLYRALSAENPPAAAEYMLTLTGAVRRWKRDVKLLRKVLHFFRDRKRLLTTAEELAVRKKRFSLHKEMLLPLKKHFPDLFAGLDLDTGRFHDNVAVIHSVLTVVIGEERYLAEFFGRLEREMPFLLEYEEDVSEN